VSQPEKSPNRAIFLVGVGRSGSTLVGQLIGELENVTYLGEVGILWAPGSLDPSGMYGLSATLLCSCGDPIVRCAFWSIVLSKLEDDLRLASPDRLGPSMAALRSSFGAMRSKGVRLESLSRSTSHSALAYITALSAIYEHAGDLTGTNILVDSSKGRADRAAMAYALRKRLIAADVLHLLRDPRATAFSWGHRTQPNPDVTVLMPRIGPLQAGIRWVVGNLQSRKVVKELPSSGRSVTVAYEDVARNPATMLPWLAEQLDILGRPVLSGSRAFFRRAHIIGGNPSRFRRGWVPISYNEEWRRASAWQKTIPLAVTIPYRLTHERDYSSSPCRPAKA
jgi:hypothetical protein